MNYHLNQLKFSKIILFFILFPMIVSSQEIKSSGCGIILNSNGDILTFAHILGKNPQMITIKDDNEKQYTARLVRRNDELDLAIIRANVNSRKYPMFRMKVDNVTPLPALEGEVINVIGYEKEDIFDPRGGLVAETNQIKRRMGLFRIGIPAGYYCSGGPVLDRFGLVIGVSTNIFADDNAPNYVELIPPSAYGLDIDYVLEFLKESHIEAKTTSDENPYSLSSKNSWEKIYRIVEIGSGFTVQIFTK